MNCSYCGTELMYNMENNAYQCPNQYCPYNLGVRIANLEQNFERVLTLLEKASAAPTKEKKHAIV